MDLQLDPDQKLTPKQWAKVKHRWDLSQRWSGHYIKVKKVQAKYGSGTGFRSWVEPPEKRLTSLCTQMVPKTSGDSSWKKGIISTSATYIWHTSEKS